MPVSELLVEQGLLQWSDIVADQRYYQYEAKWAKTDTSVYSHPSRKSPVLANLAAATEIQAAHAFSIYWPSKDTEEKWLFVDIDGTSGFVPDESLQDQAP